jgi:hypothetical protein
VRLNSRFAVYHAHLLFYFGQMTLVIINLLTPFAKVVAILCDQGEDRTCYALAQSPFRFTNWAIMVANSGLSWSPMLGYHGHQFWAIMVANSGLSWSPILGYHGRQCWVIMVTNSGLSWSPILGYHGRQFWAIMVANAGLP